MAKNYLHLTPRTIRLSTCDYTRIGKIRKRSDNVIDKKEDASICLTLRPSLYARRKGFILMKALLICQKNPTRRG